MAARGNTTPKVAAAVPNREPARPAEILAPALVLALGAFVIGVGLQWLRPISLLPPSANFIGGGVLIALGLGILFSAVSMMRAIDRSPAPEDEPSALLTDGPFANSRNPLYLGVVVVYLGLTGLLNSRWPLVPLAGFVWYFDRIARREEAYLEARFGDEFSTYRETVRRWL